MPLWPPNFCGGSSLDVSQSRAVPSCPPALTRNDSVSAKSYQQYVHRNFGHLIPISEINAITKFDSVGRIHGSVSAPVVTSSLLASLTPAPFDSVNVPTLAVVAKQDARNFDLPYWNRLVGDSRLDAESMQEWAVKSTAANLKAIRSMVREIEIVEIPHSGHMIFLTTPEAAYLVMRQFLQRTDK